MPDQLGEALRSGKIEAVRAALAAGAKPASYSRAVVSAGGRAFQEAVELLHRPDAKNKWTAVHQATSRGNVRMMRALLDAGGDLKRGDKQGHPTKGVAVLMGREKLMPLLTPAAGAPGRSV